MSAAAHLRSVPAEAAVRLAIRRAAEAPAATDRAGLAAAAARTLQGLGLPQDHLGYAMIACANAAWRPAFAAVPPARRMLLLPHCLRAQRSCRASTDALGLHCAGCGSCDIPRLTARAEALGYLVVVAEGSGAVSDGIVQGGRDAVLGVACLDSLDRSFERIAAIGLPHLAVPLLADGCVDTALDQAELLELLELHRPAELASRPSWLPLLRQAAALGADAALLPPAAGSAQAQAVEALSRDWLAEGGKRIRAFAVLAAWATSRHGAAASTGTVELPPAVRRVALAVECMHKASLVHDDIQDAAETRYARPVPHHAHGVPLAINLGDHLLGVGYGLLAAARGELGAEAVADQLGWLADAHRELCLGQGAELLARADWWRRGRLDVLDIAARKTAPAFAAALLCGLRAAGPVADPGAVIRFARQLGTCYQVLDDLDDWPEGAHGGEAGADLLQGQATILSACAVEAGRGDELRAISGDIDAARRLYRDCGAFEQARALAARLRERALAAAAGIPGTTVQELLRFLVATAAAPRS